MHSLSTPPRRASSRDFLGVSIYWFALSFFWGAMLTSVLPARIEALFPANKDARLTVVVTIGAAMAAVSQLFFGAWSDTSRHRAGRRRPFLLIGTLGACATLFFFPGARNLAAIVFIFLLIQFWVNMASGPYQALMPDRIPGAQQGAASAWIGVSGLLGRIGGPVAAALLLGPAAQATMQTRLESSVPLLAGWSGGQGGLMVLILMFVAILMGAMLLTLAAVRETPLPADAPHVSIGATINGIIRVPLRPYPSFIWLMISRLGIMLGVYTVSFCLLYYIRDTLGFAGEGESLGILTKFLLISTATGVIGTLPAGFLSDRVGKKRVLYVANTICMIAGLAFAFSSDLTLAYIAASIFGAGYGAFAAVDWALACNVLPPHEPAKYMGLWGISDTLSQVVAPLLAGPLAFWLNHALGAGVGYRALMILALIYFAAGTAALKGIRETPPLQ